MFGGLIIFVPFHIVRDLFCRDFAIIGGEGDDLVSRGFNGAGFVAIDVAADSGQHTLPWTEDRGNHRGIGLGTAHKKMHIGIRRMACGLDFFPCCRADFVLTVSDGLHHIGIIQPFHNGTVCAFQIIAVKINHGLDTPFLKVFLPLFYRIPMVM